MADQAELQLAQPGFTPWRPIRVRGNAKMCHRDPLAGPGSCPLWWESCGYPEATWAKRNCYIAWHRRLSDEHRNLLGYVMLLQWWARDAG